MKNDIAFSTPFHAYVYSFRHKEYLPLHPILKRIYTVMEEKKNIDSEVLTAEDAKALAPLYSDVIKN